MNAKRLTLKEALAQGKLPQFIKERLKQTGDKPRFDATVSSMVQKSKATPKPSSRDDSAN